MCPLPLFEKLALEPIEWNQAFRLRQRPMNPKGKTAHTDSHFMHSQNKFNGNQKMI